MLVVMVIAVGLMVDDGGNDDGDDGGDDTGDGYDDGDYGDDDGDDTTLYSGDDDDGVVLVIVIIFHLTDIIFPRYVPCFVEHCHGNLNSGVVLLHQVRKLSQVTNFRTANYFSND